MWSLSMEITKDIMYIFVLIVDSISDCYLSGETGDSWQLLTDRHILLSFVWDDHQIKLDSYSTFYTKAAQSALHNKMNACINSHSHLSLRTHIRSHSFSQTSYWQPLPTHSPPQTWTLTFIHCEWETDLQHLCFCARMEFLRMTSRFHFNVAQSSE